MPDYAEFQSVVANETSKAVLLTGSSIALLFTALGEYLEHTENWRGSGEFAVLTDSEKDTVEALVALAERELMTEYNNRSLTGIVFASAKPREGALWCDGSQYNRVDYPDLYAFWEGTPYIDGADTFHVPNLVGRFILGAEFAGDEGGEAEHVLTWLEMPNHSHSTIVSSSSAAGSIRAAGWAATRADVNQFGITGLAGNDQAHNNMPPYHEMGFYVWT